VVGFAGFARAVAVVVVGSSANVSHNWRNPSARDLACVRVVGVTGGSTKDVLRVPKALERLKESKSNKDMYVRKARVIDSPISSRSSAEVHSKAIGWLSATTIPNHFTRHRT